MSTLAGLVRLRLRIRRCEDPGCARYRRPYRPEAEGALVLPQDEFGLDVIALVGALRYREHKSVPEIDRGLRERGVAIAERTVTHLLDRYDELVATSAADDDRLRAVLAGQGGDPGARRPTDVGHEVLWVARECLLGRGPARPTSCSAVLDGRGPGGAAARGHRRHRRADRRGGQRRPALGAAGGRAGAALGAAPAVPVPLPARGGLLIFEADRHAKQELKKQVRGVRPIERSVEGRDDPEAEAVRGYCAAVRSAITDDGRPPLAASGLKLAGRLEAVAASLDRAATKGG